MAEDEDKARIYLERSKSSPISLSLYRRCDEFSHDPFFQITPLVVGRLKSLSIEGTPNNLQQIATRLSHPAPLLEYMSISGSCEHVVGYPRLSPVLFNGDLSSLRDLYLEAVCTGLPWRGMANLTSFTLDRIPPGVISITQFLDFLESAPHLSEIGIYSTTPTPVVQNARSVSLACLKRMEIDDSGPPSVFLDHLLIPVGAELVLEADLLSSLVGDFFPRSLDNLRNLSNFTALKLIVNISCPYMTFNGPNGRVTVVPTVPQGHETRLVFGSIAQLDTSRTERFRIGNGNILSRDVVHQALLPLRELRVLILCGCYNLCIFIHALRPGTSSQEVMVCPKLEELVLILRDGREEGIDIKWITEMAEARASRGKKLKAVRITDSWNTPNPEDMLELGKHVGHVEYGPYAGESNDDW